MLRSDFSRKAHARHTRISRIIIFVRNVFFQHIDVKLFVSTSISSKIEVYIESHFHISVSIDVFNHFSVNNPTTYKLFAASEKTVPHFVTSL